MCAQVHFVPVDIQREPLEGYTTHALARRTRGRMHVNNTRGICMNIVGVCMGICMPEVHVPKLQMVILEPSLGRFK